MKIIKVSYAGEVLDQPKGKNPSGKLDSQIFLGKKDPSKQEKSTKKKKKKKCKSCSVNYASYEDLLSKG